MCGVHRLPRAHYLTRVYVGLRTVTCHTATTAGLLLPARPRAATAAVRGAVSLREHARAAVARNAAAPAAAAAPAPALPAPALTPNPLGSRSRHSRRGRLLLLELLLHHHLLLHLHRVHRRHLLLRHRGRAAGLDLGVQLRLPLSRRAGARSPRERPSPHAVLRGAVRTSLFFAMVARTASAAAAPLAGAALLFFASSPLLSVSVSSAACDAPAAGALTEAHAGPTAAAADAGDAPGVATADAGDTAAAAPADTVRAPGSDAVGGADKWPLALAAAAGAAPAAASDVARAFFFFRFTAPATPPAAAAALIAFPNALSAAA